MKILLVGGTWTVDPQVNPEIDRRSSLVDFVYASLKNYCEKKFGDDFDVEMYNGGCYYNLEIILNKASEYDIVFWWANVPDNSLPKIRNVKEVAPKVMLVSSKRNDGDKYSFMELTQRALASKSNLVFEFKKMDREIKPGHVEKLFHINVFDPLGCQWFDGWDVSESTHAAMDRLCYLHSMTRQKTIQSDINKYDILSKYFDCFKEESYWSAKVTENPDEDEFINIVRKHAETFYTIFNPGKDVKRFLGNASLRVPLKIDSTRCMRGMPSFKKDNLVFVSQRNIDKQFIDIEHFVPCYMEDGKLYYCGDNKPSVDTPIQMRLYDALPNIRYMIHSHCYIEDAPFTDKSIPCGAIEEVDEVLSLIDKKWGRDQWLYYINLKGHGSIVMAKDAAMLNHIRYVGRHLPEAMFE